MRRRTRPRLNPAIPENETANLIGDWANPGAIRACHTIGSGGREAPRRQRSCVERLNVALRIVPYRPARLHEPCRSRTFRGHIRLTIGLVLRALARRISSGLQGKVETDLNGFELRDRSRGGRRKAIRPEAPAGGGGAPFECSMGPVSVTLRFGVMRQAGPAMNKTSFSTTATLRLDYPAS